MRVSGGTYCSAATCSNNRKANPELSFFGFPRDAIRCRQWLLNCSRPDLDSKSPAFLNRSRSLCAAHFSDEMFMNKDNKKKLVWSAIPTIFDFRKSKKSRFPPRKTRTSLGVRPLQIPQKRTKRKRSVTLIQEPAESQSNSTENVKNGENVKNVENVNSAELAEIIWDLENCAKKKITLKEALDVIKSYLSPDQFEVLNTQIQENQEKQKAEICERWPSRVF